MKRHFLLGLVFLVVGYAALTFVPASQAPAPGLKLTQPGKLLIIGHRGGHELGPENTLLAYRRAVDAGVDMLELDVHLTRDGEVVAIHDPLVDRTSDGTGAVANMDLADLHELDMGEGERIPMLAEILDAFPDTNFNIELKVSAPVLADAVCEMIRARGLRDQVMLASFYEEALDHVRTVCPDVTTSMSEPEVRRFLYLHKLGLGNLATIKGSALQVPMSAEGFDIVTTALVAEAHARGLAVHAWTINDPLEMQKAKLLGVDGIITDYPRRAITVMGQAGD